MRLRLYAKLMKDLSSMRLTMILLLWIAGMCIIATFIPQQGVALGSGAPAMVRILHLFSLSDMFHSLWFIVPLIVLCLNVSACMARWANAIRQHFIPRMPSGCSYEEELISGVDGEQVRVGLASLLSGSYLMRQEVQGSSWTMFGEKSRIRAYGPMIVHISILVTLAGAALGTLGFRASIEIPGGSASDEIRLDNGMFAHLPFKVRCDKFSLEYYENGMPKEYCSDISFILGERVVMKTPVMVNHPVSYRGILFFQSGFNGSKQATIEVSTGSNIHEALAGENTVFILDDPRYRVHVVRMVENVMGMGPAAQLVVETPQGQKHLWIFGEIDRIRDRYAGLTERIPEFNPSLISPYTFALEKVSTSYSTVLGLNRDPGVPFVAAGAFLFLVGILIVFLVPRSRIWICLEPSGEQLKLKIVQSRGGKIQGLDRDIMDRLEFVRGGRS